MQSLSLKTYLIIRLILFFYSILSLLPFCIMSAFSRYYFALIWFSYASVSLKAKSLTIHMKEGNSLETSSGSQSSSSYPDLICNSLDKLMIKLSVFSAFSSIVPMLLYRNELERSKASRKILVSWFSSSSNAPMPSLSISINFNGCP